MDKNPFAQNTFYLI